MAYAVSRVQSHCKRVFLPFHLTFTHGRQVMLVQ
jgi:hypothetical protein